ncbi:MAG: hypothetical protein AAF264_03960 [Pseudomonadota bacterium]
MTTRRIQQTMTLDEYTALSPEERTEMAVAEMMRAVVAQEGPEAAKRRFFPDGFEDDRLAK